MLRIGEKLSRRSAPGDSFGDKENGWFAISMEGDDGVGGVVGLARESVLLAGGGVKDPDRVFDVRGPLGISRPVAMVTLVVGDVGSDISCSVLFAI